METHNCELVSFKAMRDLKILNCHARKNIILIQEDFGKILRTHPSSRKGIV